MAWVIALGSISLGAVVGWLIRYFIRRFKRFTPQALTAVLSVVVGGSIVRLLTTNDLAIWFYFMGLLVGFILYHLTFVAERSRTESSDNEKSSGQDAQGEGGAFSGDGPLFSRKGMPGENENKKL